ncbi:MAG TPA: hypothetical protein VEQ10_00515, partial [Vicinamibacteria bacterium]|nr:hypothetical protein [Vicinamibacteria bacterium]
MPGTAILVPRVNGGINVHPARCLGCSPTDPLLDPEVVRVQLAAVYQMGFDGIRVTTPLDRSNFLAAIPYVRAARAIGVDAVCLLSGFEGLTLARALWDPNKRKDVLKLYMDVFATPPEPVRPGLRGLGPKGTGRVAFEILNEPAGTVGVPPDVYVNEILGPCFYDLRSLDPFAGQSTQLIVVSAAEAGNQDGPPRIRAMLEAGLENVCDRINYHIYDRGIIPLLSAHVRGIVWVTESGVPATAEHLAWVRDVFPEIRQQIPDVLRIFYYDLFEPAPGGYRVLDLTLTPEGVKAVVESTALHDYWAANVLEAAAGHPLVGFDELIPDMQPYLPTLADTQAFDAAPW